MKTAYTLTVTSRYANARSDGMVSEEGQVHCRLNLPCKPDRLLAEMITAAQRLGIPEHAAIGTIRDDVTGEKVGDDVLDIAKLRKVVAGMLPPAEQLANEFDHLARSAGGHFGPYAREQKPYRLTDDYVAEAILDELQAHFKRSRFEVFEALKALADRKHLYIKVYETRPQVACIITERTDGTAKCSEPDEAPAEKAK